MTDSKGRRNGVRSRAESCLFCVSTLSSVTEVGRDARTQLCLPVICIYNIYGFVIGTGIKILETNIAGRGPDAFVRNRVRDQIVDKMCPTRR